MIRTHLASDTQSFFERNLKASDGQPLDVGPSFAGQVHIAIPGLVAALRLPALNTLILPRCLRGVSSTSVPNSLPITEFSDKSLS
jgi:hypothetical protein